IDEVGEQDDQRPALEPGVELGEAEREIGLLMLVAELRGRAADAGKARDSPDRAEIVADRRVEPIDADEGAALQRDPGEREARIEGMVGPPGPRDPPDHS